MAAQYLLHAVPLPQDNVHRIPVELGAAAAARAYARELQTMAAKGLAWPRFDLVLLGLGRDGHTASLFPGSTHPSRSAQATLAVTGSYDQRPTSRVTLTPPVFNSARNIFFLVAGQEKADILSHVFDRDKSAVRFPARRINPTQGHVTWFVDRAAASKLEDQPLNN
jgi:6-phosphogluconolactonase